MAEGDGPAELEDDIFMTTKEPMPEQDNNTAQEIQGPSSVRSPQHESTDQNDENEEIRGEKEGNEEEEEEEEDEDEEPRLKYAPLTKNLATVYRNGDITSTFMVSGDKLIIGTHNGNVHVFSVPLLQGVKSYKAHDASVTSVSISPNPPPLPISAVRPDASQRLASESAAGQRAPSPSASPQPKNSPKPLPVPKSLSNEIYIATSSLDGHVCVASLTDPRDVQKRNFGRPIQAVALSPDYKNDRTYLSGGQAGNLTLTVGGQAGKSVNASTTGAAATASGWLGAIGLGSHTGTDKVLHHGEGTISTIKWSQSGKYVLWVNEEGVKIKRSHLRMEEIEAGLEWRTISHINRPTRKGWEEMAVVQKARAEWIDRASLESDHDTLIRRATSENGSAPKADTARKDEVDEVVAVGWGDMTWIIKILPGKEKSDSKSDSPAGKAEIISVIRFDDCIIAGISLYTPTLMLVLAYMEKKSSKKAKTTDDGTPRKRGHRTTGLKPELRLIDITTKEEIETDSLSVSRFETLSSSDYHLGVLFPWRIPAHLAQKGYLGSLGSGINTSVQVMGSGLVQSVDLVGQGVQVVGQGVWDATMYAPRRLGAQRLFSTNDAASIRSGKADPDRSPAPTGKGMNYLTGWIPGLGSSVFAGADEDLKSVATTHGLKIFIFSPFDCIVAVKRNLTDRVQWFEQMKQYQKAWELLDEHPEAASSTTEPSEASTPPTPSKASSLAPSTANSVASPSKQPLKPSLAEFFADTQSLTGSPKPDTKNRHSSAEKEKRRIGEMWLLQLVKDQKWSEAGEVAEKVLNTTTRWEHWVWQFIRNEKFDEISPHVPAMELTPPLSSSIFEMILGHYVSRDRKRFKELIDIWPSDLFEVSAIIAATQDQLTTGGVRENSEDWHLLNECLAKLYLADGHYKEALRCYIQLHDADTAMSLVKDHHLVEAIVDDIPSFVLLRIPRSQLKSSSQEQLETLSSDSIRLLVDEAPHGVLEPEDVVASLQKSDLNLFVYFYLKGLWNGTTSQSSAINLQTRHRFSTAKLAVDETKSIVEDFRDLPIQIFADYDRPLLMEYLHTSTTYDFDTAVRICSRKKYVDEEVFLLAKTGASKKALYLIIDELQDVSKAISFAKEQDDASLWEDLLDYSMSRPKFISGLLSEVGTAIDPIKLVKRIPSGIEVQGLKDGLRKMIREYDLQDSISGGVAQVLSSEVADSMDVLRRGRRRGIKFEVPSPSKTSRPAINSQEDSEKSNPTPTTNDEPGLCAGCERPITPNEPETIIGFACGHIYHASHLFSLSDPAPKIPSSSTDIDGDDYEDSGYSVATRSTATKVTNARLLKDRIRNMGGCRICRERMAVVGEGRE